MPQYQNTATGQIVEVDPGVTVAQLNGVYSFSLMGQPLNWPTTLVPYTPPPVVPTLAQVQAQQIASLTQSCANQIVSGFISDALGAAHTYPSQQVDQMNLVGAATASQSPSLPSTWTCNFWCADGTNTWALRAHTAAQIQQVLADGVAVREGLSSKLAGLVQQVQAATTTAAVQSIVW